MAELTHRERFVRVLTGQPADRVPFIKLFGGTNAHVPAWELKTPGVSTHIDEWLQFEGVYRGWQIASVNTDLASLGPDEILVDNDQERVVRRGDGEVRRWQKQGDFHTQPLQFAVADRNDWDRVKTRHLQAD
ncbi:MAG: hypothetical protein ACYC6L_16075, partial [Anaerolineae bacterium]